MSGEETSGTVAQKPQGVECGLGRAGDYGLGMSWQGGRAGGASFTQCGHHAQGARSRQGAGWKLKWPCPAFQPTCLAPASGVAEAQGHSGAKRCNPPAWGKCQGQGGVCQAETGLAGSLGQTFCLLSCLAHHLLVGFSAYRPQRASVLEGHR